MTGLESPETFLCDEHSNRMTNPSDCDKCALKRELTMQSRRIEALETQLEQTRERLALCERAILGAEGREELLEVRHGE